MTTTDENVEIDDIERARQAGYDSGYADGLGVQDRLLTAAQAAERMGLEHDKARPSGADLVLMLAMTASGPPSVNYGRGPVFSSRALDAWLRHNDPKGALRMLSESLAMWSGMNRIPSGLDDTAHSPDLDCQPWCTIGDGHPRERFLADQTCYGETRKIELSLHPEVRDHGDTTCPDEITWLAAKFPAQPAEVWFLRGDAFETCLTEQEARQTYEALGAILADIAGEQS